MEQPDPDQRRSSGRRSSKVLLLALLLAVIALLALLPASPPALRLIWGQVQRAALEQGFTLQAGAVRGNPWQGLTLQDVHVTHDALDVTLLELELSWGLPALLQGRLPVGVSMNGLRGAVNVQDLLGQFTDTPAAGTAGLPLRVSLGSLAVSDVQLAFSAAPEKYLLPDMTFNTFTAADTPGGFAFDTVISTADGDASVHGSYSSARSELQLDVTRADLSIVRFWWDGVVAGDVTGSVLISGAGVEADALISDASIHFLEETVSGISGSGSLRDLQVSAQVQGSALGDVIAASAAVDLVGEHVEATAQGSPQLAAVVPWLGRILDVDTGSVPAEGRLQTQAVVRGWKEISVEGSVSGSGELAGRPLQQLDAGYGFTTADGFGLDLTALWADGDVKLDLQPLGFTQGGAALSSLLVTAADVALAEGSALLLDAQGELRFGVTAPADEPNRIDARLSGPVADRNVALDARISSRDLLAWQAQLSGSDDAGSRLEGTLALGGGLLEGRLDSELALAGTDTASAVVSLERSPLGTSLPLTLEAAWGAASLVPLPLQLNLAAGDRNVELVSPAGLLDLAFPAGAVELELAGLPLVFAGTPLSVTGGLSLEGGNLELDAATSAFGLHATAVANGDLLDFELRGDGADPAEDAISGRWDFAAGSWQAAGSLPLATVAEHFGLAAAGRIKGSAAGSAAGSSGSFSGELTSGELSADLRLTLADGGVTAQATTSLLGEEWLVDASLLPELSLVASSSWGELNYRDGRLDGSGAIGTGTPLPWQLQAGPPAAAEDGLLELTLHAAGLQLTGNLSQDEAGELRATASTAGLEAVWQDGLLDVTASGFDVAALLPGAPQLPVSGRLHGPPGELQLALLGAQDAWNLEAQGTITDGSALEVRLDATAFSGLLNATGTLGGTLAAPELQADLTLEAISSGQFSMPALSAELLLAADGTLELHTAGQASAAPALQLTQGQLSGTLDVPLTLLGRKHSVLLLAGGSSSDPQLTLEVAGPLLAGSGRLAGSELGFELDANAAALAGTASLPDDVRVQGSISLDGSWQAHAGATLELLPLPLVIGAQAQGRLLDYDGFLNVRSSAGERLLSADFNGSGSSLELSSDLQSLAATELLAEAGLTGNLQAGGELRFSTGTSAGDGLSADATLAGEVSGLPLDLRITGDRSGTLEVSGQLAGEPLDLQARFPPGERVTGQLQGSWAGAQFDVTALPGETAADGSAALLVQGDLEAGEAGSGSFTLDVNAGAIELRRLQAQAGAFTLQAAGPLLPETRLTGAVQREGTPGDFATLQAGNTAGGLQAALRHGDLELLAQLEGQLQLRLHGSLALQQGTQDPGAAALLLTSDLNWNPAAGFSGGATLDGPLGAGPAPLHLHAQASGSGSLALQGALRSSAAATGQDALAAFTLQLPANPLRDQSLAGQVRLAANLRDALPGHSGRPTVLSGSLAVGGNLARPVIRGPLALDGLLQGAGSVELQGYAASGSARLEGENFRLESSLEAGAWDASLTVQQQPLAAFLPWLPGANLDASVDAHGAIGQRTQATLSDLRVTAQNSLLEASGTLGSDVQGVVNLDLDLADAQAGLPLAGRVRGTLTYGSTGLQRLLSGVVRGTLQLDDVLLPGGPVLSGSGQLIGSARDPELRIDLRAGGSGSGELQLVSRPASQVFELSSTVAAPAFSSDFRVTGDAAGLSATGELTLPDGSFRFTPQAAAEISLSGSGAFRNWTLSFDPASGHLQLNAFLQTVVPSLQGQLVLDAGLAGSGAYLRGQLYGLQVAGLDVGDVTLTTENLLDGWLDVSGERVNARVNPAAGLAWELQRLELQPLPALSLVASGAGQGVDAAIDLVLTGRVAGEFMNLPARLTGTPDSLTIASRGVALGGRVSLDARLADGSWQGEAAIEGLQLAGTSVTASGEISGERLAPRAALFTDTTLGGVRAGGELTVGLDESGALSAELRQELSGGPLQDTLVLAGTVLPQLQLELRDAAGGAFTLQSAPGAVEAFLERPLVAAGELQLPFGPVQLGLGATSPGARLQLELPALPGLELAGNLDLSSLAAFSRQLEQGVVMQGQSATRGEARFSMPAGELELSSFGLSSAGFDAQVSGSLNLRGEGSLTGHVQLDSSLTAGFTPEETPVVLPFAINATPQLLTLESASTLGSVSFRLELPSSASALTARLENRGASLDADLQFDPEAGLDGRITLTGLELLETASGPLAQLDGVVSVDARRASGDLQLQLGEGVISLEGSWGLADLLPGWLAPGGERGGSGSARLVELALGSIPFLQERAPHLAGTVSGELHASRDQVSGHLTSADLAAAGTALPLAVEFTGSPSRVELGGTLGGSPLTLTLANGELEGLLELRRFPFQLLAQAVAGPLDATAEVTGVTRFRVPLANPAQSELRLATELIRLESDGVVTTGNLGLDLTDGLLEISGARFEGAGSWEAAGVLRRDELDFELTATDADFSPLLSLIPALALLDTSAAGSLQITARGSLERPRISIASSSLDFRLAGISYRLDDIEVLLLEQQLTVDGQVLATDPVEASLRLGGGSRLSLAPLEFSDAAFTLSGSAVVPVIGALQQLEGSITAGSEAGAPLLLDLTGAAGAPFRLAGSLLPLDLRLSGDDLQLNMPALYLADTQLDVDLRLIHEGASRLSGSIFVDQARIALQGETGVAGPALSPERGALELGGNLHFDGVTLRAPARVRFNENFGTAELAAQLTLAGSLSDPLLTGYAQALRGTLQFSGRDFEVRNAVAQFDPNTGLYPLLDFTAVTSFEKQRVLPPGSSYEFVSPRDRNRIEVRLSFQGELAPDPGSGTGFRLSVQPVLSSDALVQESRADGLASGPRELTENELLSLITLGRVEFGQSAGPGGFATAVAEGALGTALDVFVLSELQRALGEALGIDVVEIRSSAVSNLLSGGNGDAFSVSLRLGGYLSEEVFASYRIGAFDDPRGLYSFTNEVLLTYELGPLELDLAGRVNFTDAPELDPGTELSVGLRYAFSDHASLETGVDLSNERQQLRFGVTLRW